MIDPDLCQRLAAALGTNLVSPQDRQLITDAALKYETWEKLPPKVQALVEALEGDAGGEDQAAVTASSSVLYAGHAHELYGLDAGVLPSVYGLPLHDRCDLLSFCRNPLHPGPCKGWKHTLKAVAPGVHAMLERDRLDRVEQRRKDRAAGGGGVVKPPPGPKKSRKGQGDGRDGDGDGLKGEGEYEKKGRKKGKAEEPPVEDNRLVKLRPETRAAVAAAVKALPKDDEGWRDVVEGPEVERRDIDEMVNNAMGKWAQKLVDRNTAEDNFAKSLGFTDFTDLKAKAFNGEARAVQSLDGWRKAPISRTLDNAEALAKADYEQIKKHRDDTDALIAAAGGVQNGRLPARYAHLERSYLPRKVRPRAQYAEDANGVAVPSPELAKMHAAVQKAGEEIQRDLTNAFANDPDLRRMMVEMDSLKQRAFSSTDIATRMDARKDAKALAVKMKQREQAMVLDALGQFRPVGGQQIGSVLPITDLNDVRPGGFVARRDWRHQLDVTGRVLPDDWVSRSNRRRMEVIGSDRAYHSAGDGDWRADDPGATTLAMNTDKGAAGVVYDGAFGTYVEEVTVHEYGHRMETTIPGLKALEFAYVRSRTTHNGVVEPLQKLKDIQGGGYDDHEVAYKDKFPNAYIGKSYEGRGGDPMNASWEVFQVGLQDTLGRSSSRFGDETLQHFTLGVMAALDRR